MARKKLSQADVVTYDDASPDGLAPGRLRLSANDKVEFDPAPGDISVSEATAAGRAAASIPTPPDPLNPIERAWEAAKGAGKALYGIPGELQNVPRDQLESAVAGRALSTGLTFGAASPTKDIEDLQAMRARVAAGQPSQEDLRKLDVERKDSWGYDGTGHLVLHPKDRITDPLAVIDAEIGVARRQAGAEGAAPGVSLATSLLTPTLGKGASKLVMKAGPAVGAGARILQSGVAGLTAGGVDAGGRSTFEGNGVGQVLGDVAGGAGTGLAIGLAGGATVEGGRKVLQSAFPAVGDFAQARESGLIPKAEAQAHGRAGVKAVAFEAADAIEAKKEQLLRAVGELHAEAMAKAGAKPAEMQPLLERLAALDASARFPEGDVLPGKEGASRMAGETFDAVTNAPRTVEGMVKLRRAAAEAAAFESQSPSDAQLARRDVYGAIRSSVRESAPEVAAADDAFAAAKQSAARTNENLYGTPKDPRIAADAENAPAPISPRDRIKAMTRLARYGERETAEPSTSIQPYLDDLAAQDPEFAKALDAILAKKALEDTRFGLGHGTQKDLQGVMHGMAGVAGKNAGALARRADDVVLRGAGQRSSAASNFQRFLDAYEEDQRRNQSRADAMRPAR